jgi:hypothetical protein
MNEEEKKQPKQEERVAVMLTRSEIFQLNLCVVARLSTVQAKFVNAYCEEEQKSAEALINYLTGLSGKITEAIKDGQE